MTKKIKKNIYILYFQLLMLSFHLFGGERETICINKILDVSSKINEETKEVSLKINSKISDFKIPFINGIDGLIINNYEITELVKDKEYKITFDYEKPLGRSFIVFSVMFNMEGSISKKEVISIAVGELSESQKEKKSNAIKTYGKVSDRTNIQSKINPNSETFKVHQLPLSEK